MPRTTYHGIERFDEIDTEMVDYMATREKVKARELSELVGISVPSIRVRLFRLMAIGVVGQERTRDHHTWFFLYEKGAKRDDSRNDAKHGIDSALQEVYDVDNNTRRRPG